MAICTASGVHCLMEASWKPHDNLCALLRKLEGRKLMT